MDSYDLCVCTNCGQRGQIMLSIRDEEVRTLAETVMRRCGAPNLTAAIKLALKRADEAVPLAARVAAIRAEAMTKAVGPKEPPLTEAERDALWGA
jgi:antitoxin VapB